MVQTCSVRCFEFAANFPASNTRSNSACNAETLRISKFSKFSNKLALFIPVDLKSTAFDQIKAVHLADTGILDGSYIRRFARSKHEKRRPGKLRLETFSQAVSSSCQVFVENDLSPNASLQNLTRRKSNEKDKVHLSKKSRSTPWLKAAYCRLPLSQEEERILFLDVQDLLYIESKKEELQQKLGQNPTDQEWADFIGCSIYRLYARLGTGRAAIRKMIAANLPLVASVAKQFHGRGLSHQELCQEGVMGLFKSTEKFSIAHDTKFSTYSFFWIFERMSAAVKKFQHIVPIGKSVHRTVSSILKCKDEFRELHGRDPTINELALASRVDKAKIRRAFIAIRPAKSFNVIPSDDYQGNLERTSSCQLQDPKSDNLPWLALWKSELKAELDNMFVTLTPRESQVLYLRYGLDGEVALTLFQVAAALGLSHEAVRVTEKIAIRKLRESAVDQGLQHYITKIS